jgi:hypothetical protein
MTCQKGTEIIGETVRRSALEGNEAWTSESTVRVCYLNTSRYWNEEDRTGFVRGYEFLGPVVKSARVADECRK